MITTANCILGLTPATDTNVRANPDTTAWVETRHKCSWESVECGNHLFAYRTKRSCSGI